MSVGCTELVAALSSCYIKLWQHGVAAEGSPTDSHKNNSERPRNGETDTQKTVGLQFGSWGVP